MSNPAFHIALLRGINVGGKHKLPMKDLLAMFAKAGCADARNYIQSGNVVFRAKSPLAKKIPGVIAAAIRKQFGFEAPVLTRTATELRRIVRDNPYLGRGVDEKLIGVGFLADLPTKARVASLDPDRSPPDEFEVRGREIYFCFPNGSARSKLTNAYFDSKLSTTTTVRNWRTTLKLVEMATD